MAVVAATLAMRVDSYGPRTLLAVMANGELVGYTSTAIPVPADIVATCPAGMLNVADVPAAIVGMVFPYPAVCSTVVAVKVPTVGQRMKLAPAGNMIGTGLILFCVSKTPRLTVSDCV